MNCLQVDILGSDWRICFGTTEQYPLLKEMDGYTDSSIRQIVIDDMSFVKDDTDRIQNMDEYRKKVVRHELIHAFLCESGLDGEGSPSEHWERNEEMIDWFAIQIPKMCELFEYINVM